ncbi:MAG: hypothetical protein WA118_02280 [Carboxydocellales bacterium]
MDISQKKRKHFVTDEFIEGRKFSGFTVVVGPLLARIYNKSLEIVKSGTTWFNQIWEDNGWKREINVGELNFKLEEKYRIKNKFC